MLYRHDHAGEALAGSKQALIEAIRRGAPLRLAWGFASDASAQNTSVEHAVDPVFLSIIKGADVFVQPEHIGQTAYTESDKARFDRPSVLWRA